MGRAIVSSMIQASEALVCFDWGFEVSATLWSDLYSKCVVKNMNRQIKQRTMLGFPPSTFISGCLMLPPAPRVPPRCALQGHCLYLTIVSCSLSGPLHTHVPLEI